MSHVLIWKNIFPGGEYDIFRQTTFEQEYTQSINKPFNVGNRLWFQGLMSAIDTKENHYDFLPSHWVAEEINATYDFILLPMANIFSKAFLPYIIGLAKDFAQIKIPVYVIACGAQAVCYDALDDLIRDIGEESKRFISAIYQTGGEFALRGYFTKEFFTRLGFHSAVVTGCPSMYQFGRGFVAATNDRERKKERITPVFNGQVHVIENLMNQYKESVYVDQDMFWGALYSERSERPSLRSALAYYRNYGKYAVELLAQDRIKLIPDMYNWHKYLINHRFNYSFGTRIHGNIMAILSGIPATVVAADSRTREMAEFFDIPYVIHNASKIYSSEEFLEFYHNADYAKFNKEYVNRFNVYEDFLISHNIISKITASNSFFSDNIYIEPLKSKNNIYFKRTADIIEQKRILLNLANIAATIKSKVMN